MNENFIRERISSLRIKKGISEYKMSLDLGHSKSYIQSISSGKSLPSLSEFLYICEYLGVTPKDFFDTDIEEPALVNELYNQVKTMQSEDLLAIINLIKRLNAR
jgi:transcriptional regulator with XRE-family HTH domain